MESVPEPRPSEWDKRLSTHSPFRTLNINGQIPTGVEGVSTLHSMELVICLALLLTKPAFCSPGKYNAVWGGGWNKPKVMQ